MSANKIKTAVSLTADCTQVRYQKAIKQINKLIGVNTDLRQANMRYIQTIGDLNQKLHTYEQQKNNYQKQRVNLEDEINQLNAQKAQFVRQNEQLKKQIAKLKNWRNSTSFQAVKKQNKDRQREKVDSINHQQYYKMQHFQKTLEMRNQTIADLLQKIKRLEEGRNSQRLNPAQQKSNTFNNQLTKKLHMANQYIQKINAENYDLKNKLIRAQSNRLITARSLDILPKYTPQLSPRFNQFQSKNSEQVLKRYHKLQQQNKRLTKKYESLKSEVSQLSEQNKKLKKQNKKNISQISGFEALITKQQEIISQLHVQYDKQVIRMTDQFKQKLIDQRQSFSPAKSADHLKQIQALQIQNKSLKKKFQLCSIQLTKCFKTLEVYRIKLSECEKDYSDLINQRQQLTQKLSKLQASHRQKSSYSRSSNSKIPDNQRRNSMGETGYFNYN